MKPLFALIILAGCLNPTAARGYSLLYLENACRLPGEPDVTYTVEDRTEPVLGPNGLTYLCPPEAPPQPRKYRHEVFPDERQPTVAEFQDSGFCRAVSEEEMQEHEKDSDDSLVYLGPDGHIYLCSRDPKGEEG